MRFLNKQSLPQKQTSIILLTCGVALLIACVAFAIYDVVTFRRTMVANVSTIAEIVGNNCEGALDFHDPKSAEETVSALRAEPGIEAGCVYDKAGEILASYSRENKQSKTLLPPPQRAGFLFKGGTLHVFKEIRHGDELMGTVYVQANSKQLYDRLERYGIIVGAVFVMALLIAAFLSMRLQKLISGPILDLVQTTRSIAQKKDYSMRAAAHGDDELSALVSSFNEMLAQIQIRDAEVQKAKEVLEQRVNERTKELENSLSLVQATETVLRKTEEVYRRAIGGAGAVPYSYSYKTRTYSFIGEGIEELTGYKPHEISPHLWKRIIKESIMQGETSGLEKTEAAQKVLVGELKYWRCDMRIVTREGKTRWLSDASVQNTDDTGLIGSVGILQDITERKQAEISAVAFSRMGYQLSSATSAKQAAEIISTISEDLLGWDSCWLQLYSEKDDLIYSLVNIDTIDGKRVFVPPAGARKTTELHRRIVKSGPELILRDNATAILPGAVSFGNNRPSASLMFVPIRSVTKVVGILSVQSYTPQAYTQQDLRILQALADQCGGALERIWADEARRKSEAQFRAVWNTSVDGMRLVGRDGIVQMVNDAYCRMIGKTREELEGRSICVVHAEPLQMEILRKHSELFESGKFRSRLETHVTLWDGRRLWFEISNSLLEVTGQPSLMLSIFRDITQRKQAEQELETIHRQLVDASRQAGMAEVATGVLHNVGNVLNSVNVSASIVADEMRQSKANNLVRIAALLKENEHQLGAFFSNDPRGKQLAAYLITLADHLSEERKHVIQEMDLLRKNIEHIKDIVVMQQNYAKVSGVVETVRITDLVEDALNMNAGALKRHHVRVVKEYNEMPPVSVERHKVLQILVNLIRNAKYACDEGNPADKLLTVRVTDDGTEVAIAVVDNGIGIPPENLTRIFNHGFTTRPTGHGFGLHSGALAAKELGGFLTVESEGKGKGATFVLHLPRKADVPNQNN